MFRKLLARSPPQTRIPPMDFGPETRRTRQAYERELARARKEAGQLSAPRPLSPWMTEQLRAPKSAEPVVEGWLPPTSRTAARLEAASPSDLLRAIELSDLDPASLRALMRSGGPLPLRAISAAQTWRSPGTGVPPAVAEALQKDLALRARPRVRERTPAQDQTQAPRRSTPYRDGLRTCSKRIVEDAIERAGGNKSRAARELGLTREGLYWILRY
jgi:hypothetical protein